MIGINLIVLLIIMVIFLLFALTKKSLLKSAVALGAASVILTIILFIVAAPWGAVFELSVCAGLITVVFISTISMTDLNTHKEELNKNKKHDHKAYILYFLLLIILCIAGYFLYKNVGSFTQMAEQGYNFKELLWNSRQTDIVGQIILIFAAIFGIAVFFKEVD